MKSIDHPVSIAKKIINSLEEPFFIGDFELYITASIGITSYPADGEDAETLMKKADTALFRAKDTGKNAYQIYNSAMNIEAFKLYSLERGLRKAIKNRELSFHYQPKVDTRSGRLTGAEALIRWIHPEWGMVSPGEFIPLAEETDLIFKITDYTFHTVCRQINEWEAQKLPIVPISINISPKLFLRTDWLDNILRIIEETRVNPEWLELEIVETALIHNEEAFLSAVHTLKKMGVKISLDDFGTGFSSLLYLKKFNFDTVKIDRSFIKDFLLDSDSMITKSIIYLAHGLKLDVVAEGVETQEQLEFLRQQGCDQIQGYLFSKPLPVDDFTKVLMEPVLKPASSHSQPPVENRRKVSRFDLPVPLSADMTIAKIKDLDFTLGKTEVLIENIGFGGLRLLTHLKLPVNPEILYEFETELHNHPFKVCGRIVWKQETNDDFFQYGVEFKMDGQNSNKIKAILNDLESYKKNKLLPPGSRFIKEESIQYLKQQISQ
jgi:EAL domain-containing protein (putative c-di-GMP-specific phosphodiesterase class I)